MHGYGVIVFFELLDRHHFVCNKEARSPPTSTSLRQSTRSAAAIMLTVANGSGEVTHMYQCHVELEWRSSSVT